VSRAHDAIRAGTAVRTPKGAGEVTCVFTVGDPPALQRVVVLLDDSRERETFPAELVAPLPLAERRHRP
jgi:hypothetical protein